MKITKISGLLISAGLSVRMGSFKPLMNYEGEPFVVVIVKKLLKFCERVIIVTGYKSDEIELVLNSQFLNSSISQLRNRIFIVFNADYEKGMFTSLKTGIKELHNSDWVLYHFVDQPFFPENFYEDLISRINAESDWIQPVHQGEEGHPLLFNKKVVEMIAKSFFDSNLRTIRNLPAVRKNYWECNYPEVLLDFDTPEEIEKFINR
ncbi:MAG: NTP transferase domain-containing protein [Bacteroidota bacterium]